MAQSSSQSDTPSVQGSINTDDKKYGAIEVLDVTMSTKEHAKLLRKIDWHLFPLLWSLYFLSFLDRASIGNAKVAGMSKDLHLVGLRYNIAAAVFFIPYCFAQIPSNIILKLFRPSRWIPMTMFAWGVITTLTCLVNTFQGLVIVRAFLGLAEAGLFPGVIYYISLWYPRAERAKRIAVWLSAASMAGAFGGLLAYGIEMMEGIGGLRGWQWIFCLEGIVTVLLALVALFYMYDYPDTASFLTENESYYHIELLKSDSNSLATHFELRFALQALKDYKTYLQFVINIGILIPTFSLALFMPTIIHELGFSAAQAQLLSVPPFAASCISMIICGIYSDRHQLRGPYVIAGALVALVGFTVLYTQSDPAASYAGAILAAIGVFSAVPSDLAWAGSNAGGDIKRGVALATVIGFANLGGVCSSFIYFDPPRFQVGHGTMIGFLSLTILFSSFAMWDYNRLNKRKERVCRECGITAENKHEFRDMGDDSPLFRYTL
ncbi:major facilitator superfamily domain-containing protein [Chiua virens]|nr:major facilitator superfamily domain-containing protein [Chiua virens]